MRPPWHSKCNSSECTGRLIGVRFQGERHDAGDRLGYLMANIHWALKRPDLRDGLRAYMKKVT